jgi:hypothetical protein
MNGGGKLLASPLGIRDAATIQRSGVSAIPAITISTI